MPITSPSAPDARLDALADLRQSLAALGEVELTLTLRAEQLPDEGIRGVLECVLHDHLGHAIAELKQLARELAAPPPPSPPSPSNPSVERRMTS